MILSNIDFCVGVFSLDHCTEYSVTMRTLLYLTNNNGVMPNYKLYYNQLSELISSFPMKSPFEPQNHQMSRGTGSFHHLFPL